MYIDAKNPTQPTNGMPNPNDILQKRNDNKIVLFPGLSEVLQVLDAATNNVECVKLKL